MDSKRHTQLLKVLKRIPVFADLSPSQLQKILGVCASRSLQPGDALFEDGDASDEMYVLLSGAVAMTRKDGIEMARFEPISPLGEVGIVTDRPRQVTARAVVASSLLVLPRKKLQILLGDDLRLAATFYRNVIGIISRRIDDDNVRALEHEEVRSRLTRTERELELAYEAIGTKGLDATAVRAEIDAALRKSLPTILVVDDETEIRQFLTRALAEYDVVAAEDGVAALDLSESQPPALVITDINMPRMDGLQLLEKLKAAHPDLPVIGLSGEVKPESPRGLGFDDFILKPMRVAALRNMVKAHLEATA